MPDRKSSQSDSYAVGFKKPPEGHRFRSGISGNPKGRPKGSYNVSQVLARTLLETVVVNENGQRKTITKLEATVKQVLNKAASGDLHAAKFLIDLARMAEQQAETTMCPNSELNEKDRIVMQGMLERIAWSSKEEVDR